MFTTTTSAPEVKTGYPRLKISGSGDMILFCHNNTHFVAVGVMPGYLENKTLKVGQTGGVLDADNLADFNGTVTMSNLPIHK